MADPDGNGAGRKFEQLVEIMARLRAPDGCPWDREQTFDSIKPYTIEETYEVLDAIDARDWRGLAEELGDYMLQAVFYAQMAADSAYQAAMGNAADLSELHLDIEYVKAVLAAKGVATVEELTRRRPPVQIMGYMSMPHEEQEQGSP